jgi:dTMP kinase
MKEESSGNSSSIGKDNRRGRLVTLDGIDGVGKSTQIEQLATFFRSHGLNVTLTRDPGGTPVGARLREILLDSELAMHRRSEAMLFMASRSEMVETIIRPALQRGDFVISDRYLLSNVVYQSVGGEVPPEELWQVGRWATGGLDPDLTLLFDMPAEESIRRMKGPADRMESRGVEYLESVRQAYRREVHNAGGQFKIIDAAASESAVTAAMIQAVSDWLR